MGVNKRRKVVTTVEDAAELVDLEEGWIAKFQELPGDQVIELIGYIADHCKIKTSIIKKVRTSLPSFADVKWIDFAEDFGLRDKLENNRLERVVTPVYSLPPSVHEIMFEAAWRTQDVYQERHKQRGEAARLRIMDPYLVRIMGFFQGRVIDRLGQDMLEKKYATGGKVEHNIFMIGGIVFFIAEFKLHMSMEDNVAQLFVEILDAAKANEEADFANLRIYGLLTNLSEFCFYSYDPLTKRFASDKKLFVNLTRDLAFTDMIPVCNKIFGVILTAYIDGLKATVLKSIERKNKGDVSFPGSAPLQQIQSRRAPSELGPSQSYTSNSEQKLTDCWEVALQFAEQCCDMFNESVETDDIERNSTAALELLAKSVRSIPRASDLTGADDPSSTEEIKDLAHCVVHKKYLDMMKGVACVYAEL